MGIAIANRIILVTEAVADPGFPRGGGANPRGGRQPIIWPIFPKNCMKMKKFWARGGPLDPPLRRRVPDFCGRSTSLDRESDEDRSGALD